LLHQRFSVQISLRPIFFVEVVFALDGCGSEGQSDEQGDFFYEAFLRLPV